MYLIKLLARLVPLVQLFVVGVIYLIHASIPQNEGTAFLL